jgi:hypothetical protein
MLSIKQNTFTIRLSFLFVLFFHCLLDVRAQTLEHVLEPYYNSSFEPAELNETSASRVRSLFEYYSDKNKIKGSFDRKEYEDFVYRANFSLEQLNKSGEIFYNDSISLYLNDLKDAIGGFSASGSEEMSGIARWNGSQWEKLGGGLDGTAYTATVYNGKLAVGGRFKKADGRECNGIAIWDGSSWSDLDGGFQGEYDVVLSLLANGEELIVGGDFEEAGDVYSPYVIKWDVTQWVELPSSVPSSVGAMTIYNDKLYIVNGSNLDNNFFLRLD